MLFALSLDEKHDAVLRKALAFEEKSILSSAPVDASVVLPLWEHASQQLRYREAYVGAARLCAGEWPANTTEAVKVFTQEPTDVIAWRRRNLLSAVCSGNMIFVADTTIGGSQELILMLTFARMNHIRTAGIVPAGLMPASVPLGILSAADVVLSGEADGDYLRVLLRSLKEEG